ncbi:MAG: Nif3-like dinuclear metal center hexameric protein [Ruminococcaceae bacterium]|nr:Nif3-like dinuclear metal center hexameric protein [Oscillospiraceae bacterium]
MPTKRELYDYLDTIIPRSLSCDWDNDGLMCCAKPEDHVKKLLVTLDITDACIEYANKKGFDTIVSHHPLIFKGIKALNTDMGVSNRLIKLMSCGICAMSFHTRLDAVSGGVNDALAEVLGLRDVEAFGENNSPMGRVGTLPATMRANELAIYIKEKLSAPYVNFNGRNNDIKRLAVLGGAGEDEILLAEKAGADAYLTGELGHHPLTDACDMALTLFEAGHHYTEFPVCKNLAKTLKDKFSDIEVEIYNSIAVKTV